jgi:transposase
VERLNRKWARVKLPKFGWVRLRWSRPPGGSIRSATVSRDGNHWYISLLVEDGYTTPEEHAIPGAAVGVDRGVAATVMTSDGRSLDREFATPGELGRCRRLQQQLARQGKRSKSNRRKATRTNACKHVDPKSRESQAVFRCTACGFRCNADVNAAKNVLAAGLAVTGVETSPSGGL